MLTRWRTWRARRHAGLVANIDELRQELERASGLTRELADVERQVLENHKRLAALAVSQPELLVAALNGSIGGRVGFCRPSDARY